MCPWLFSTAEARTSNSSWSVWVWIVTKNKPKMIIQNGKLRGGIAHPPCNAVEGHAEPAHPTEKTIAFHLPLLVFFRIRALNVAQNRIDRCMALGQFYEAILEFVPIAEQKAIAHLKRRRFLEIRSRPRLRQSLSRRSSAISSLPLPLILAAANFRRCTWIYPHQLAISRRFASLVFLVELDQFADATIDAFREFFRSKHFVWSSFSTAAL